MDEVFALALHRVIVPQRVNGDFVIEVDEEPIEHEPATDMVARSARTARRTRGK
jgi:hypothetical protein